jgi:hypothetical protein
MPGVFFFLLAKWLIYLAEGCNWRKLAGKKYRDDSFSATAIVYAGRALGAGRSCNKLYLFVN